MKKLFLLAVACFFAVAAHSAEPRRYYYLYNIGYEDGPLSSWFEIDTERMVYTFDRAHRPKAAIRNYRKQGNKETFDIFDGEYHVQAVELVTEENRTIFTTIIQGETQIPYVVGSREDQDALYKRLTGKEPVHPEERKTAFEKMKGGVKNAFNKTKDVFKKN